MTNKLNQLEATAVDAIAATVPWLAPLAPAFMVFEHLTQVLGFPFWLGIVMAVVVEALGLSTIHTAFMFLDWNQNGKKVDHRELGQAPMKVALGVAVFYLLTVMAITVVLDLGRPWPHLVARILLTLISVPAGIIIAIRAQHKKKTATAVARAQERSAARKKKVTGQADRTVTGQPEGSGHSDGQGGGQVATAVASQLKEVDLVAMKTDEVARLLGVSERTARRRKERARLALVKSNGHHTAVKEGE